MSLTSFLEVPVVKKKFKSQFTKPIVRGRLEPKIKPRSDHYSLVGTAFDYLARMYVKRQYPRAKMRKWVAEETVELVRRAMHPLSHEDFAVQLFDLGWSVSLMASEIVDELVGARDSLDREIQLMLAELGRSRQSPFYPFLFKKRRIHTAIEEAYAAEMHEIVDEARVQFQNFRATARPKYKDLARACLLLAQIDPLFRAGKPNAWLGVTDEEDVADLCELLKLFRRQKWLRNRRVVLLNPTFGKASLLVGGADADLVLDNMLVDIKCTKSRKLRGDTFHQLIGYYILSRIEAVDGAPKGHRIDQLAVYFARHGELYVIDVKDVLEESEVPSTIRWFTRLAHKYC